MSAGHAADKENLLAQFGAFLDQRDGCGEDQSGAGGGVDLHSLLAEMAALKNEVRLESRQFKGCLDDLRAMGDALRQQNERLARELDSARAQAALAARQAERSVLVDMLEVHERLRSGMEAGAAPAPSLLARLLPARARLADSLAEGLALSVQRFDDILASYGVRPLEVLGKPLDPHTMRAVGTASVPAVADGVVLRETRRGFFHHDELIRTAEVIVNKRTLSS